ncbi:MAG TPA: class I SAM-dependent RNA methyltransferase [Syntrophales bacterium]|nr:class I SAM-dependent RNA methyltransferase [Syntrophales bacterium]
MLWTAKSRILVTCAKGVGPYLKGEIASLGFRVRLETPTFAETEGSLADAMRLNLHLRTAQRVLYSMDSFSASHPDELYARMKRHPWEDILADGSPLSVTSFADTPSVRDGRYINQRAKDAIVDRIRDRRKTRPDSGPERLGAVVHVHWSARNISVYLDTSGEPLYRRGYRRVPLEAPLQETLAAAILLATGWNGQGNCLNPMCGSGTIAIEAAFMALKIAPGFLRKNFGFMHLRGFRRESWEHLREDAGRRRRKETEGFFLATDIRREALEAARINARTAGVETALVFRQEDFADTAAPGGEGIVVLNPPYGERMGDATMLATLYRAIGDFFKHRCQGYRGYIFTGNPDLAKEVGLRTKRRIPFFNGDIPCRLLEYELYAGSRKGKYAEAKEVHRP